MIRQVRPQRVLTSSPERFWERIGASHPDHMTVGESTLRAVYPDARNPFAFPELLADEGLEAWTVSEVWLGASPRADHAVDVTDVVDRKFAALRSHVSQVSHNPDLEKFVTGWMAQTAQRFGLPEGRLAEAFHVVHTGLRPRPCRRHGRTDGPARHDEPASERATPRAGDVTPGTMFGSKGLRTGTKFFAIWWHEQLVVKLPPARLTELVEAGDGQPFEPMEGRRMNGWIVLGDSVDWAPSSPRPGPTSRLRTQ